MASKDISINIKGKDELSKPVNKATASLNAMQKNINNSLKPFSNLSKSVASMTKSFAPLAAGFVAVAAAAKKMNAVMRECEEVWKNNELAYKRSDWAAKLNANLKDTSYNMKKWAKEMSNSIGGWIDDGDLLGALNESMYSLSSAQIKNIGTVAADLMAATGADLQSAVNALAQSYSGTLNKSLKMVAPELANLTKEELENGKALEILKVKIGGAAEEMKNTANGSIESYKVALSGLKSEMGAIFSESMTPMRNFFTELFGNMATWLSNMRTLSTAQHRIKNGTASSDDYQGLIDDKRNQIEALQSATPTVAQSIWQSLMIAAGAKSNGAMAATKSGLIAQLQEEEEALLKLQEEAKKREAEALRKQQEKLAGLTIATATATSTITKAAAETDGAFVHFTKTLWSDGEDVLENLAEMSKQQLEQMKQEARTLVTGVSGSMGSTGDIGSILYDYFTEEKTTSELIVGLITPLINQLSTLSEGFQNFMNLADEIYKMIADDLIMVFDLLQPIFDVVMTLMNIFNPILKILIGISSAIINLLITPLTIFFDWLKKLWVDYIAPFFNKIIQGINWVINGINNVILAIAKFFKIKDVSTIKTIGEIDTSKVYASTNATGTTSGSATYSGAKDVYVNIYYNHSFVNGDAREIALTIRDELTMAEKLGY